MTAYFERVGRETDVWLNVTVWGGKEGVTVSTHAALDRNAGNRTGCVVCAILGALVERNHCTKTLDPTSVESTGAAIRAGLLMLAFFCSVGWAISLI